MKKNRAQRNNFWFVPLLLVFILPLVFQGVKGEVEAKGLPELHLGNADLRMVFRSLAELGEFPLLLGPAVQGQVTLPLRPGLTAEEAVALLAEIHGYPCHWVEGVALVGADPTALGERAPREYQWSFLDAETAMAIIAQVIPRDRLPSEAGQKEIQLNVNALEDANLRELLTLVDQAPVAYIIKAELVEFDLNQVQERGLAWALPSTSAHSPLRLTALPSSPGSAGMGPTGGRLLAETRLRATSSQAGVVFLGDQYPVIISKPDAQIDLIEYQRVGLGIEVLPRTLNNGKTGLDLVLTVNGIGGWTETVDGRSIPLIENNRILAQQTLAPGETFVLAGLSFAGKKSSALLLTPGREGPDKEKSVCLLLTPQVGAQTAPGAEVVSVALPETPKADSEVVHIQIFGGEEPEVVTTKPPVAQVLTEVVGLGELQTPAGEESAPTERPEQTEVEAKPIQESATVERGSPPVPAALRVAYRVVKGDTIFSIARKYGVDPTVILQENAIGSSDLLQVGQTIRIPIPPTHLYQLQPKETLWRIAQRYGTTVELLIEINSITDVTALRTDQIIILPVPADQVINDNY
jgi:LysM repeat protein